MGKIITPAQGTNFANKIPRGDHAFAVVLVNGGTQLTFTGDIAIIIEMLYDSMSNFENVAKTVISAAIIFADQKNIPITFDELKKHSFITDSKIIQPTKPGL